MKVEALKKGCVADCGKMRRDNGTAGAEGEGDLQIAADREELWVKALFNETAAL